MHAALATTHPLRCAVCSQDFNVHAKLLKHLYKSHPTYWDEISGGASLERMLHKGRVSQPREKKFACQHCSKCFSHETGLLKHLVTVHPDKGIPESVKFWKCEVCKHVFTKESYLYRHMEMKADPLHAEKYREIFKSRKPLEDAMSPGGMMSPHHESRDAFHRHSFSSLSGASDDYDLHSELHGFAPGGRPQIDSRHQHNNNLQHSPPIKHNGTGPIGVENDKRIYNSSDNIMHSPPHSIGSSVYPLALPALPEPHRIADFAHSQSKYPSRPWSSLLPPTCINQEVSAASMIDTSSLLPVNTQHHYRHFSH